MAFNFRLEGVLRYRKSLEQQQKTVLQTLLATRAALQQQLRLLHEASRNSRIELGAQVQREAKQAAELHFTLFQIKTLQSHAEATDTAIEKLKVTIQQQTDICREHRQKREALEIVREAQWQLYLAQKQRRDQRQLDELFLLRKFSPSKC